MGNLPVFPLLSEPIVTVFTFKGGNNGKRGGGTVRHACFVAAQRRLNICYSCADADFPLLSEPIVTVFTFRGGDNGKRGGGTIRHACFVAARHGA